MKTITFPVLLLLIFFFSAAVFAGESRAVKRKRYVDDEVIFRMAAAVDTEKSLGRDKKMKQRIERLSDKHQFSKARPVFLNKANGQFRNVYKARLAHGISVKKAIEKLKNDPEINWAEPNYYRYTAGVTPNDPSYSTQSYLRTIYAHDAWETTKGSSKVVIAVIDTGVEWYHADLRANIWQNINEVVNIDGIDNDNNGYIDDYQGWDFVSVDSGKVFAGEDAGPADNNPDDFQGHGTHVAGIAAAVGNNGVGVTGVSWNSKIMPLRAGYKDDSGDGVLEVVYIVEALKYAADNGADIVNMSFGGKDSSIIEREAIQYCADSGVLLIAAAGNDSSDQVFYPAADDNVIAVASVDRTKLLSDFSNYGTWVDIAAPGDFIYSTLRNGSYGYKFGTSMASPVVCGVAALIKSARMTWSTDKIKRQLYATSDNINSSNPYIYNLLGAGLVNADMAVGGFNSLPHLAVVDLFAQETGSHADGIFAAGETIKLWPSVKSYSNRENSATVVLSTDDPYINILDNTANLGIIKGDHIKSSFQDDCFIIEIAPDIPLNHSVAFDIKLTSLVVTLSDRAVLLLNPLLNNRQIAAAHNEGGSDYIDPFIVPADANETVIICQTNGFAENHLYAVTRDVSGRLSDKIRISKSSDISRGRNPKCITDPNGVVHVAYYAYSSKASNYEIGYVSRNPSDRTWSEPLPVSRGLECDRNLRHTIAVDSSNRPHIIWADNRIGNWALFHTYYNGTAWTAENMVYEFPANISLFNAFIEFNFDSDGRGYLLWSQQADGSQITINCMTFNNLLWNSPSQVMDVESWSFSIAADRDKIHMIYPYPNSDDVSYRSYYGGTWSSPQIIMRDTFYHNSGLIQVSPDNSVHVIKKANFDYPDKYSQLFEIVYSGGSWSLPSQITFDAQGTKSSPEDFLINDTGNYFLVDSFDTDGETGLGSDTDIILLSSDLVPDNLPDQPFVTDDGVTTGNRHRLAASWSVADTSGITEYQYAVGTSPGKTDKIYWGSAGLSANTSEFLSANPLVAGQRYYASVRAKNNNGYFSVVGVSDGIEYLPGDLANDGIVNLNDLSVLSSYWLDTDCSYNSNCYGADYEPDGDVDSKDLSIIISNWLQNI